MIIKSATFKNFKCFEEISFEFNDHFNLITGFGGAGKTSMLEGLTKLFELKTTTYIDYKVREKVLDSNGIYRLHQFYPLEFNFEVSYENQIYVISEFKSKENELFKDGGMIIENNKKSLLEVINKHSSLTENETILPVMAYFSTERSHENQLKTDRSSIDKLRGKKFSRDESYSIYNHFDSGILNFIRAEIENKANPGATLNKSRIQRYHVDTVNKAVIKSGFFENTLGLTYDSDMGAAFLEFPGNEFRPLLHLSEGQKIVLNLILNIAFKICVLNPHLENPLDFTEGIVLIDELDLHLHPAWQRNIVHALKDVFPKIQFFATSHSPQIIGELKPEEIIVLDNTVQGGWWRPPASFGMNSADILKTIMDAPERNSKISTNIGEAFRLINAKQYQEAEIIVANLRKEMGSASDVVQLEAYLSRYLNTATQGVAA